MRLLGVPDEEIEAAREQAARFAEPRDEAAEPWAENQPAVDVFRRCAWEVTRITGMETSRLVYEHISSSEIESVCNLLGIPAVARRDVLDGVRVMEATARPLLNR